MPFWQELRQRNVVKVGTAYLAVAWLITQVIANLNEPLGLPDRFDTIVVVLLAIGFPIALIIAWAFELTPHGIRRTDRLAARPASTSPPGGQMLNYLISAALVLAVGFLLVDRFVTGEAPAAARSTPGMAAQPEATTSGRTTAVTASVPPLGERIRLAVLPLRVLANDDALGFFADGLIEQLTGELKRIPELLVTDRAAAFAFRDKVVSHAEIADTLGVAYVLDGSIATAGGTRRIAISLTRVEDGTQLWATTRDFGEGEAEIFAIQDEITTEVATALSVSLGVLESRRPGMTRNVEAYTSFLTGLGYGNTFNLPLMRQAIPHYQRAIALDPGFIAPRIVMYFTYTNMLPLVDEDQAAETRQRADEALALIRALAPAAREVALIDAIRSLNRRDWGAVERYLAAERADPTPTADERGFHSTVGSFLLRVGRIREAIEYLETARALAPQESGVSFNLVAAYQAAGDIDAAFAEIERGLALAPDNLLLTGQRMLTALASGDRAIVEAQLGSTAGSDLELWHALGERLDDRDAAIAEIRRRVDQNIEQTDLAIGLLAHWANYFGAPDLALEIVQSLPREAGLLPLMIWDYGMRDVRRLPGFRDLAADLNLVDYWREYGWPDYCAPADDDFVCE